jgi:hypothetical protein
MMARPLVVALADAARGGAVRASGACASCALDEAEVSACRRARFASWGEFFDDSTVAAAILDRLLHHATVLQIDGDQLPRPPEDPQSRPQCLADERPLGPGVVRLDRALATHDIAEPSSARLKTDDLWSAGQYPVGPERCVCMARMSTTGVHGLRPNDDNGGRANEPTVLLRRIAALGPRVDVDQRPPLDEASRGCPR